MLLRLRRWWANLTRVDQAAIGLVVLFAVMVAAWFTFTGASRDWTSNIGVDALSIALTISVVDRIVRGEASRRDRRRVVGAMEAIERELGHFAMTRPTRTRRAKTQEVGLALGQRT